ncbi:MAG: RNA methyltransferase [Planctomycetota bacterium]|nr:MAG: RNA methyltransferase [Planctomycetota bacterium]
MLANTRIVLVRPIRPGNVGAACRAMANMGLRDLVIVSPACALDADDALGFAARGKHILQSARVVDSIADALDDCVLTFAATGKGGLYRKQASLDPHAAAQLARDRTAAGRVAIAFGPEDRGLLRSEVLDFDHVIEIPADPQYPVLNLAAAVMVVCYEWRRVAMAAGTAAAGRERPDEPLADDRLKRVLFERLFTGLDRIGFFSRQQTSDHLRFAIRRALGRAALTVIEADVLIGMASQIHWYVDRQQAREGSGEGP